LVTARARDAAGRLRHSVVSGLPHESFPASHPLANQVRVVAVLLPDLQVAVRTERSRHRLREILFSDRVVATADGDAPACSAKRRLRCRLVMPRVSARSSTRLPRRESRPNARAARGWRSRRRFGTTAQAGTGTPPARRRPRRREDHDVAGLGGLHRAGRPTVALGRPLHRPDVDMGGHTTIKRPAACVTAMSVDRTPYEVRFLRARAGACPTRIVIVPSD
jgi:hypothetical protein